MTYKHLFFDLDHTLWDFENNSRAVLEILFEKHRLSEVCGIALFEDFRESFELNNERFWIRYRKGFVKREELRWKRMWHTLLDFDKNDMELTHSLSDEYLELLPNQNKLMPFAKEVLEYCREKGYQLHLITNGYEEAQWKKMKQSEIDHYFLNVITSENSKSLKPQKEIFEFALQASGAFIKESLMIGDAIEADILGAQAIGMDQVYFNFLKKEHAEKPTFEINSLEELKRIL